MNINKFSSNKTTEPQKENSTSEFYLSRRFFLKSISACGVILISGCASTPPEVPHVTDPGYTPGVIIPPEIIIEKPDYSCQTVSNVPSSWYPPRAVEKNWTAIVVHHSASDNGNMALFDKNHKEVHGWDGVGYDFIIGNGTDSGDGEIEVTYRWKQQKTGAHCWTPDNWANRDAIGICLVGNFNDRCPSQRQMNSLAKLTDFLRNRYNIPKSKITGHRDTPGAHVTDCPGNKFPMPEFKAALNS